MPTPYAPITELLAASARGEDAARERLWAVVYHELRRIAAGQVKSERRGATLQPTALVHEAYLRLLGDSAGAWANRTHFFATAAKIMRQIRVDDARRRKRRKRGGGNAPVSLDRVVAAGAQIADEARLLDGRPAPAGAASAFGDDFDKLLALDDAIERLRRTDETLADVVVLRFHGGLTREQISEALGLAPRTVDLRWAYARAWLKRALSGE